MAGYLRNLAESVLRPSMALHPLRQPASAPFGEGEVQEREVAAAVRPTPTDVLAPHHEGERVPEPPGVIQRNGVEKAPAHAVRRHFHAPRTLTPSDDATEMDRTPDIHGATETIRQGRQTHSVLQTHHPAAVVPSAVSAPRHAGPEIPRDESVPVPKRTGKSAGAASTATVQSSRHALRPFRDVVARPVPARAEAGEAHPQNQIHIHIGRIEFSAETPALPARRKPAATHRPLTLDAYLRQRRGSSE